MIRTPSAAVGEQQAVLRPATPFFPARSPDQTPSRPTRWGVEGTEGGCGLYAHTDQGTYIHAADSQDMPHQPPTELAVTAGMEGCSSP